MSDLIAYRVGDTVHVVDVSALTGRQELRLYQETGLTFPEVMTAVQSGRVAPFLMAAFVFLARVQKGDLVTYDQVSAGINYSTEVAFADPTEPPPEPQGVDSDA